MKALLVKRKDGSFYPALEQDYEICKKVEPGSYVTLKTDDVRDIMHHRKFFALLKLVHHHLPEIIAERLPTQNHLLHEIKMRLGHYDAWITPKGSQLYIPRSIAFDSMGQKKFEEFYSGALDVIFKHYLTSWTPEQVEAEILNFY